MRIDRQLDRVGEILLAAEARGEQVDHARDDVDHGEGHEIDDDRAHEAGNDRRIAADEGLADETRDLRDGGENRDIVEKQIGETFRLLLDEPPFRLWPQQDRLDPLDELHRFLSGMLRSTTIPNRAKPRRCRA